MYLWIADLFGKYTRILLTSITADRVYFPLVILIALTCQYYDFYQQHLLLMNGYARLCRIIIYSVYLSRFACFIWVKSTCCVSLGFSCCLYISLRSRLVKYSPVYFARFGVGCSWAYAEGLFCFSFNIIAFNLVVFNQRFLKFLFYDTC